MAYRKLPQITKEIANRFWKKVKIQPNGCWEWQACITRYGYASFGIGTAKSWRANRVAYKIYYGIDPGNLLVCHSCDNRKCVNPLHLFLGTHASNATDRDLKGRHRTPTGAEHGGSKLTDEDVLEIRRLLSLGHIQSAVAERFAISQAQVSKIGLGANWKQIGGKVGSRYLTEAEVREIRSTPKRYGMNKLLGQKYGVTANYISDIRARKSWKEI